MSKSMETTMANVTGASASERELLLGIPEIAECLGLSAAQARYLTIKGVIPVFKLGAGRVCAKRSALQRWLENVDQQAVL